MKTYVRIREVFKLVNCKNKLSGHEWTEPGPTTGYEVVGPFGTVSRHTTERAAEKSREAYEEFYQKFPPTL